MPSIGQENLETVMIDFFGALRGGDFDAAASLLAPDVAWQGLRDEWVCHGPEEVLETFRMGLEQRREIDALEFTRGGDSVVLGARGPEHDRGGRRAARGTDLQRLHAARRADQAHRRLPESDGGACGSRRRRGCGLS
jgi:SnoaL-like domain